MSFFNRIDNVMIIDSQKCLSQKNSEVPMSDSFLLAGLTTTIFFWYE